MTTVPPTLAADEVEPAVRGPAPARRGTLPPVARVLARRALQAVSVTLLVSTACFVIVQNLPGDMAYRIAAGRYGYDRVTTASADAVRADLGLDAPAWQQLARWWADLAQFDLGTSLVTGGSVVHELRLPVTSSLQLAATALALAVAVGAPVGMAAAWRPGGLLDRLTTVWVAGTRALPPFLLGLLLIMLFSVHLGWLPAVGHGSASNVVLPAVTLAVGLSGLFARVTRDTVAQLRGSGFVTFAETKGLRGRAVLARHVLRNAGVTLVAYVGAQALILIEGVVVVESLFAWPGLGRTLVHAIFWRDVPVIQAAAVALALLVVLINTVVDVAGLALDPRPRWRQVVP
ncbi:peptide/nickel transport system permease protein [Micromonospora pattaloongensis]|uniref:Peptide/nickel transport system permease protein n=1 Tax=Micromonospora pattaloongensis TaxID=405436 RepID=A0A1H3JU52_9ACTN|nr:ABC transporter permease [Micromonospora pattaloongensis]SDY42794.1 peptide/nickel transport system permease protein [Micromonospora pattaloongensis]